ncbi:hypothetical protein E4T47_08630 [Aureobasidium subglaciale]|nr:hypothetical protein E4T43_08826 [Aureobasidium subglaciale]KAI5265036.1 hypothetical protein E4T47_08630 [Aureobasidium subglaciale]
MDGFAYFHYHAPRHNSTAYRQSLRTSSGHVNTSPSSPSASLPSSPPTSPLSQSRSNSPFRKARRRGYSATTISSDPLFSLYRKDSASSDLTTKPGNMETATIREQRQGTSGSVSSAASNSSHNLLANPFELRYGRRYLRDVPYPLPCDLSEIQRQSLRTLLGVTILNKPSCVPNVAKDVPKRVLELGCGSAFWTGSCHEWFASLGYPNVEFTGLDFAPLAPDLRRQGVNWKFIQHDFRRFPWPFEDNQFDYIMLKDLSLTVAMGVETQRFMDETLRILAPRGTLEIWESDHVLRCLLPQPPPPRGMTAEEDKTARDTKTYLISPTTPFAPAQNRYISDSNTWIHAALDKLNLPSSPCTRMAEILYQETTLVDVTSRRIAIPLGQMRWEKDSEGKLIRSGSSGNLFGTVSPKPGKAAKTSTEPMLTDDQAAIRSTALLTVIQKIESLEPLLKEASGKNSEEWTRWWAGMMASLLDQENSGGGSEVLEIGAWWATKCEETT